MVDVIKDLGLASILLLLGYGIRSKVKLFQKLYIPAAVIGGVIGLLLGGEVLGKFCPVCLHFSSGVGSYANPLLAIVFSSQFLGTKLFLINIDFSVWEGAQLARVVAVAMSEQDFSHLLGLVS